jgi:TRAP-type C4-dicarboxylate transport system permease small subunit
MRRIADVFVEAVLYFATAALMGMLLVEVGNIIGRPMGVPVYGSVELTSYLGAIFLSICVFYATLKRSNVVVGLIAAKLGRRARSMLDAGVSLVGILTALLLVGAGGKYAWNMMREGEHSLIYGFNLAYIRYAFTFSLLLVAAVLAMNLHKAIRREAKK